MKIICIVGPTGVGKTRLSLELSKQLNGEVINADSTQVYKTLNIATAKIKDYEGIKHHLIDIATIKEDYTVFNFKKDAKEAIKKIENNNNTPIIVGGTGLYIKALLYDYKFEKEEIVINNYEEKGNEFLYNELTNLDPNHNIHPNNKKRLIRALNYYNFHQKPISEKAKDDKLVYDVIFIGLTTNRNKLYEVINNRVDQMLKEGLVEEAKSIYESNIRTKAVLTPIGYKELFPYFDNSKSLLECTDDIKQNTRNYAKKQFTWFKNQMDINWFSVDYQNLDNTINEVISYIKKQ